MIDWYYLQEAMVKTFLLLAVCLVPTVLFSGWIYAVLDATRKAD